MSKQSSVEWFAMMLAEQGLLVTNDYENLVTYKEAIAMHQEETEQFGAMCCLKTTQKNQWSLEQLYNETFGGNNE